MVDQIRMVESKKWIPVSIPDNVYAAETTEIKDLTIEDRPVWAIAFKLPQGQVVEGLVTAKLTDKSKLYRWLLAFGIIPTLDKTISKSEVIGKKCRVVTKSRILQGGLSSSFVSDVLPPAL